MEEILIGFRIYFTVCNDPGQPSCDIIRSCQEEPDKPVLIPQYGNSPFVILGSYVRQSRFPPSNRNRIEPALG